MHVPRVPPGSVRADGSGAAEPTDRVVICNPVSGSEDHLEQVHGLAADGGWELRVTEAEGDAREYAREAAESGTELVAAAGGDGTVNEVVDGFIDSGVEEWPALLIVPAGTGNNAASNLGIESIGEAFSLAESGRRRRLDLGRANDRAFLNSCIGGLTAEASLETDSESKRRFGVLAYVLKTIETATNYDGAPLRVTLENADVATSVVWEGDVALAFIGNCRRFGRRQAQAHAEDGLLEVTLVENASMPSMVGATALDHLFDLDADGIARHRVPRVTIESLHDEPITYSLDGEVLAAEELDLETLPGAISVVVGDDYASNPDAEGAGL
ncbi:diacylglycerol/lipid kinase family protein [Saliphagus sp. GCM10025317]